MALLKKNYNRSKKVKGNLNTVLVFSRAEIFKVVTLMYLANEG